MNQEQFTQLLAKHNIEITDHQLWQFDQYYQLLVDYNTKVNLTAITAQPEVYAKHFYDSLLILFDVDLSGSFCDVGAGAGFPSIPLKIMRPDLEVVIVEPLQKRVVFLELVIKTLGLQNIKCFSQRAEEFVVNHRESFDWVSARAVANLNILAELCIPLVKIGGSFVALKGDKGLNEAEQATKAVTILGAVKSNFTEHHYTDQTRFNLYYRKVKTTDRQYPRNYSKIKAKPLT